MNAKQINNPAHLLTDAEFLEIREYFTKITGNKLGVDKRQLVESRLRKKFFDSKDDVKSYIKKVQSDPKEQSEFISILTTHKTDWFREKTHFDFLNGQVLITQKHTPNYDWKIWSAACSTGEEIYSILMHLNELNVHHFKLLGTDISDNCINNGTEGIYSGPIVDFQVPKNLVDKYFISTVSKKYPHAYKFNPIFYEHIKWRNFNLVSSELKATVLFDFIFLRNVLIYFDAESGHQIAKKLYQYLKPGGFLVIGLSESIIKTDQIGLKRVENSIYKKV
jgi:chemotaxis protein methyltransferase CheR